MSHLLEQKLIEIRDILTKMEWEHKNVLSLNQAAQYMDISKSFLYKLTCKREIPFSKPGAKVIFFKRTDLDEWMLGRKFPSKKELSIIPNQRKKEVLLSN